MLFQRTNYLRPLLAALAIAAFGSAAAAQDITIGAILPLTGPAAPTGIQEQQGVIFAVDKINAAGGIRGRQVKVIFEDSQAKPDQGVLGFNRLADLNKVPAIMTAFSSISLAIAPLATRREILVINPAAQANALSNASPYMVNTIPTVGDETRELAKFAADKLGKSVAIIYENAAAGIDGKDDFKKGFEAAGGKVILEEPVEFGQTNFRSTLLKVAAAKPDFVHISMTQGHDAFAEQVGQISGFPKATGTSFSRPFFGFKSTLGWFHSAIESAVPADEEKAFIAKFNVKEMGFFEREYYNSTNVLLKVIDATLAKGQELTGKNLRENLFAIKTFNSGIANLTFEGNTAKRSVEILTHGPSARERVKYP